MPAAGEGEAAAAGAGGQQAATQLRPPAAAGVPVLLLKVPACVPAPGQGPCHLHERGSEGAMKECLMRACLMRACHRQSSGRHGRASEPPQCCPPPHTLPLPAPSGRPAGKAALASRCSSPSSRSCRPGSAALAPPAATPVPSVPSAASAGAAAVLRPPPAAPSSPLEPLGATAAAAAAGAPALLGVAPSGPSWWPACRAPAAGGAHSPAASTAAGPAPTAAAAAALAAAATAHGDGVPGRRGGRRRRATPGAPRLELAAARPPLSCVNPGTPGEACCTCCRSGLPAAGESRETAGPCADAAGATEPARAAW